MRKAARRVSAKAWLDSGAQLTLKDVRETIRVDRILAWRGDTGNAPWIIIPGMLADQRSWLGQPVAVASCRPARRRSAMAVSSAPR